MTDGPADGLTTPALEELITSAGHVVGSRILPFTRLAASVQLERHTDGASNTRQITRSTALWTLMRVDQEFAAAFAAAGVDESELGKELSIRPSPGTMPVDAAPLHRYFADAMRAYLTGLGGRRRIDLPDVAAAIVAAVDDDDKQGLLPGRMRKLSVSPSDPGRRLRGAGNTTASCGRTATTHRASTTGK